MERKPISLEKEKFDALPETDYNPLHYNEWININVEEKNEIVPSYDNSDNFRDEYIMKINRIQGALAYISNNSEYIRDNPGYIQISNDAADFCSSMIKKISINDRVINDHYQRTEYYLEQTETIVKYIEHRINYDNNTLSQQFLNTDNNICKNNNTTAGKKNNSSSPAMKYFSSLAISAFIFGMLATIHFFILNIFVSHSLLTEIAFIVFTILSCLSLALIILSFISIVSFKAIKQFHKSLKKIIKK